MLVTIDLAPGPAVSTSIRRSNPKTNGVAIFLAKVPTAAVAVMTPYLDAPIPHSRIRMESRRATLCL